MRKTPGEFAFRIVGTSYKGSKAPAAQGQLSFVTTRAKPGIAAIFLFREKIIPQERVQLCRHFRRQFLHYFDGLGLEVMPEGFENGLPLGATTTDFVEFVFQRGRIIISYVTVEKPLEKSGQ